MQLPPTRDILEAVQTAVLPAAAGAALVASCFAPLGRRAAGLGSAAAVAFALVWANFALPQAKPGEPPAAPTWSNTTRLVPWLPEPTDPGWKWLGLAGLLLVVTGVVSRTLGMIAAHYVPERRWWVANVVVWLPRAAAAVLAAGWVTSGKAAEGIAWLWPAVAAVMLLTWVALDGAARVESGPEVAAYLGVILYAAGVVLLYAHSARFMELAVVVGSAMFGLAVAAGVTKTDTSGAVPAAVAFLPGLVLAARPSLAENAVPGASFWLVALAPLGLLPFRIPALARKDSAWLRLARAALVLVPVVVAVLLAARHEKLAFEEEY